MTVKQNNGDYFRSLQFTALDGEGVTIDNDHFYNLMIIRDEKKQNEIRLTPFDGESRLATGQIFYILSHLPRKNRVYVAYYFDYDISKWLEDMSVADRITLYKTKELEWTDPLLGYTYRIKYIPRKLFAVAEFFEGHWYYLTIYDVFAFFQTSFAKALVNWNICSQDEVDYIQEMKNKRAKFNNSDAEEIARYCSLECGYLCRLMYKVRDALAEENIYIHSWYGSGAIGQRLLEREEMKPYIQNPVMMHAFDMDKELYEAVMGSYFGGRFELMRQGIISETYQYDINGAYPYAMITIPDFSQCDISYSEHYTKEPFALWYVTYDVTGDKKNVPLFGPLPYRKKNGTIIYPLKNNRGIWTHAIELETVIRLYGRANFKIHGGYIFLPKNYISPFRWISGIASHRLALKKKKDLRNVVLKLGLNSLYGKLAQGIGSKDKIPPFQNYYLAGYVTAHCRSQLLKMAWTCGEKGSDVIQFATDGVFSKTPSTLYGTKSSEKLGEWEYTKHDSPILYLQPGVYFASAKKAEEERKTKRRTRGFKANKLTASDVFAAWEKYGVFGTMGVLEAKFYGIGTCLVLHKWSNYGRWLPSQKEIEDYETKGIGEPNHVLTFDPMTKMYMSGWNASDRINMWNWCPYKIVGITKEEVIHPESNYYILIPDINDVTEPSRAYIKKRPFNAENLDELLGTQKEYAIFDIQDMEQGDYERLTGFDPLELGW